MSRKHHIFPLRVISLLTKIRISKDQEAFEEEAVCQPGLQLFQLQAPLAPKTCDQQNYGFALISFSAERSLWCKTKM